MSMQLYDALRDAGFDECPALKLAKAIAGSIEARCACQEEQMHRLPSSALIKQTIGQRNPLLSQVDLSDCLADMKFKLVFGIIACNAVLTALIFIIAKTGG